MSDVTWEMAKSHGLSDAEWAMVLERLGRAPNYTELGVISVMWSEHCSYKSSRLHLKKLPTEGPHVLQGPGENAGAIDIGEGWAAVFKMESHNHPSYIEPYQGAATGVGGILRDVFTMGARPIASLDSLRFGAPDHPKTPHLVSGVVGGIAGYGNCVGVATVGGELWFDPAYNNNILVNVFNLGVCKHDQIFRAVARGVGNPVLYVGAKTGRDGIHGATMASAQFDSETEAKRPTVQVGDPFREKLLIEACQELLRGDAVVAIQDMGAAGLTSSSVEMAGRGGLGIEIDVDRVPRREPGMNAYECLLSESQERMLVVAARGKEVEVERIFAKWDLDCAVVGRVTDTGRLTVLEGGQVVVELPIPLLTEEAPQYDRPTRRPAYLDTLVPVRRLAEERDLNAAVLGLVGSPNLCSRRPIFEQYDHMVGVGTLVRPGADAAVVRIPGTSRAVAMTVDCNGRYCYLDPNLGTQLAAAECARNLSVMGAQPAAVTDCLNFGSPQNPEVMWQLVESIEGLAEACRRLETPVVSGNVSLYNETDGVPIYPTPMIAMVGVYSDGVTQRSQLPATGFQAAGDAVVLLGRTRDELGGSQWARQRGQLGDRPPHLDWPLELALQKLVRELIRSRLIRSAHDCAEGGLAVALAECCIHSAVGLGMELSADPELPDDVWLFSESASRVVVSCGSIQLEEVVEAADAAGVPTQVLGMVASDRLRWPGRIDVAVAELRRVWESGLEGII